MLLEINNIKKQYTSPDGSGIRSVLDGVSLDVEKGEAIAIQGPSGSGKSTLLNIIGGLDKADEGAVRLNENTLSDLTIDQTAKIRNTEIGFIFQLHHLLPQCTVLENVLIPTIPLAANERKDSKSRAMELLKRVGLKDHMNHHPPQLSGGEQQRVAVVRALINDPVLILADEPTGSLDRKTADDMADLLTRLNQEHEIALITVTHSEDLAKKMQKQYQLKNGQLFPA